MVWQPTSDILAGKFRGGEEGPCPVELCKQKKSSAEFRRNACPPQAGQGPGGRTGAGPLDLLASTTTRCLLRTSQNSICGQKG